MLRTYLKATLFIFILMFNCSALATDKLTINTKHTQQPLNVTVTLPQDYLDNVQQRYIVFYTTASERRIGAITEQIHWMSHVSFGPIPPMIIVQLPYIEAPREIQNKDTRASGLNTSLVIKILKDDILPLIKQKYRVQPFRILEGYSTNANLPLNILAQEPPLFNAYISINPAWVLDKNTVLDKLIQQLASSQLLHRSLYISLGSFSQNTAAFTKLKDAVTLKNSKLSVTLDDQRNINYYTAPMSLLPIALEGVFSDRHPKNFEKFAKEGVGSINRYYQTLAIKYGFEQSPINALHDLSDYYIQNNNPAAQIDTLKYIVMLKPNDIFYHIMLANSFFNNSHMKQYQLTIQRAKELAKQTNNQEALAHIDNLIKRNKN